jgi:hypothetical protein
MDEIGSRQYRERRVQFARAIPDALAPAGRLLYVGGKPERVQILDLFFEAGWSADILEVWHENAVALKLWPDLDPYPTNVIEGDVRTTPLLVYDSVVWWHGPEHVDPVELPVVLRKLEAAAMKMVILASPWGRYAQGPAGGNPFETHLAAIYPSTLKLLGYQTDAIGKADRKGSNLLAWKRIR